MPCAPWRIVLDDDTRRRLTGEDAPPVGSDSSRRPDASELAGKPFPIGSSPVSSRRFGACLRFRLVFMDADEPRGAEEQANATIRAPTERGG